MVFLENEIKVSASYVTKKYSMNNKKSNKTISFSKKSQEKKSEFWALCGISFEVRAGETVGIIGTNGSGKSTLSNIIAGSAAPTSGEIKINGKTSIIAIGSGLKNELTGRENVKLKCLLSGMSNKEIDEVMDEIILFADLGDFIDQPLKTYSSGMRSRLGFSISVHHNPDILIIDEALSVGDDTFYQRCLDKMKEFKDQGKTIFFVSHSRPQILNFCEKVMWIHEGKLKSFGPALEILNEYREYSKWYKALSKKEKIAQRKEHKIARQSFDLNHYCEEVKKDHTTTIEDERLEEMFYPTSTSTEMSLGYKLMISVVSLSLVLLAIHYIF